MKSYLIVGALLLVIIALLATNKKLVETVKNIFKIEELRKRLLYTCLLILVYRLGCYVVIPGIDPNLLGAGSALANQMDSNSLLGLLNVFSGGAFANAAIFALGVMPYITASIIIQLLGMMVPAVQKLMKEGESGRRKMNQWTRYLTIAILALQGPAYITNLHSQLPEAAFLVKGFSYNIFATLVLIGGTMFIMWLGERLTDRGLGNGISLIIMVGIIARLPFALIAEVGTRIGQTNGGPLMLIVELVILFFIFIGCIALVQGKRKIPVQYAKRVVGNKQYGGVRQYIPLKMNAANVMPIIFAQALMFVPGLLVKLDDSNTFFAGFQNVFSWQYNVLFALLIIIFTFFYTAITIPVNQMADDLKRNGGLIPKVRPGKETSDYLDDILSKLTLPGSIFLAIFAILPALVFGWLVETQNFALFFGGTSLLIMVGVILDTVQQINTYLLNHHYDGLMQSKLSRSSNIQ